MIQQVNPTENPFLWAPASKSKKKLYPVKPVLHRHVIPFNIRHLKADCFYCRSTIVPREATPKPKGFLQVIQHGGEVKHHGTRKFEHLWGVRAVAVIRGPTAPPWMVYIALSKSTSAYIVCVCVWELCAASLYAYRHNHHVKWHGTV